MLTLGRSTFGKARFFANYVIVEIAPETDVGHAEMDLLIDLIKRRFADRPFGYVSDRRNSYSVDPMETRRLWLETNVLAAAFVIPKDAGLHAYSVERRFYNRENHAFVRLRDALEWLELKLAPGVD